MGQDNSKSNSEQNKGSNLIGGNGLNNNSSPAGFHAKSAALSEEDVPYTSFSVSKPRPQSTSTNNDIVTVSTMPINKFDDLHPEITALSAIPVFTPLLKTNSSMSLTDIFIGQKEPSTLDVLNPDGVIKMCHSFQKHAKKVTMPLTHDQKVLAINIKLMESFCSKVTQTVANKLEDSKYYSEMFKTVSGITNLVAQTNELAKKVIKSLDMLNKMLPDEDRLEPITTRIPFSKEFSEDRKNTNPAADNIYGKEKEQDVQEDSKDVSIEYFREGETRNDTLEGMKEVKQSKEEKEYDADKEKEKEIEKEAEMKKFRLEMLEEESSSTTTEDDRNIVAKPVKINKKKKKKPVEIS